jgi:hypothetical protein
MIWLDLPIKSGIVVSQSRIGQTIPAIGSISFTINNLGVEWASDLWPFPRVRANGWNPAISLPFISSQFMAVVATKPTDFIGVSCMNLRLHAALIESLANYFKQATFGGGFRSSALPAIWLCAIASNNPFYSPQWLSSSAIVQRHF